MTQRSTRRRSGSTAPQPAKRLMVVALLMALGVAACGSPNLRPSAPTPATASSSGAHAAIQPPAASQTPAGASTSPQAPASGLNASVDACALITPAEVSEIVGGPEPVGEALPAGGWVAAQCAWSSPVSSFLVSVGTSASIKAFDDPASPDAKAKFADFKQRLTASGGAKDALGIGDGAVLGAMGLAAVSGGTYLQIVRLTLTDEQLTELAKRMVGNL